MADYYQVLGISRFASQEGIRKTCRKRTRRLHPDVASPEKVDELKAVNEAYDTPFDAESRRVYDLGGTDALRGGGSAGGFGSFTDILEIFFGGMAGVARGPVSRGRRGQNSLVTVTLSPHDVVFGVERDITHTLAVECGARHGTMAAPGTRLVICSECDGVGMMQRVANSILGQMATQMACPICHGFGTVILMPCADCSGQGHVRETSTAHVQVPAGVEDGMRIRVAGKGEAGAEGGRPGDSFVEVHVGRDRVLYRDDDDLACELEIPVTASVLGCLIEIETFDGPVTADVSEGIDVGRTIKFSGLGVGRFQREGRDDPRVVFNVKAPAKLDDAQRSLLEKLVRIRGEKMPVVRLVQQQGGFFSKLRDKFRS